MATVLSAQTTDARVNGVTPALFAAWPDAPALAGATEAEVLEHVRGLGMGPTRARRIIALARALVAEHEGRVPEDQASLESLPGVGRKTALVVRGAWFGHSALAVDTHVGRLARRLGWSTARDPLRVERDVVALAERAAREQDAPPVDLTALSLRLILHGRTTCTARRPHCEACRLADLCPSAGAA